MRISINHASVCKVTCLLCLMHLGCILSMEYVQFPARDSVSDDSFIKT